MPAPASSSSMIHFDELPLQRPGPPYNAWSAYGEDDELGRLNLITPEVVKAARDEITHGIVVNLNLPLTTTPLNAARTGLKHDIIHRTHCNDDHVSFNTQASTQWDGFRHYPYQNYPGAGSYVYYNDMSSEDARNPEVLRNGIHNYAKRPVTSRAHLLDIAAFIERHQLPALSFFDTSTPIPLDYLRRCASESNVVFRSGDILLVRTGFTEKYLATSEAELRKLSERAKRGWVGIQQGEQTLRWHWDNGIAAVASDTPAYECMPAPQPPSLHEVFLAGWGMPIGELFDLRQLATECAKIKKWTFFFTSMVLNIPGGIASPPNAQAIL